ncbi:hypothetical protein QFC20_006325 [Naganishia adeliensis]|uniref:Uncharacterized protein n=1 Tax=Naganishia adeliensis TaxID=92952 RepID=A0ACC2VCT1_9TREE|nr:hypothetical protein QFC20_006325 [Naganishia adeliensis]
MFLVPSHLRATIHSILTASPLDGPHTALLTSTQGQIYVSGSTYDPDWAEDLERPDPLEATAIAQADEADETDDEDGDVEPDLSMPEWRRTLRGMANREWKEHVDAGGKDTDRLRLQCDIGRILFVPLCVPSLPSQSPDSPRQRLPDGNSPKTSEDTSGRMLLVLNGKTGVKWSVLDSKADTFVKRFRTRTVDGTRR